MRTVRLLATMCVLMAFVGGCPPKDEGPDNGTVVDGNDAASMMTVVVEGGQPFPEELAGTWRADRDGWEFVIDPNGSLSSAVISMGRVRIQPGRTAVVRMVNDGQGRFEPGPWALVYDPASRLLTIHIEIKELRVEVASNLITGKSRDTFVGSITPDGNTWAVVWTAFPDYQASTDGGATAKPLNTDEYGIEHQLVFDKVPEKPVSQ